ncbi:MAG: class I SAM-dependent methyltransferase [Cyanobacteria bacterium P01_C01_bin.89]
MPPQSSSFSSAHDVATEFDQWAQSGRGDRMADGHRYATEQLLEGLAITSDSVVLDAGCGVGWVLNDLIGEHIASGVGIDLSAEMIDIASSRCTLPHLKFAVSNSAQTPFGANRFSHIVSIESLYYVPDPLETLREWLRITQPGGRLGLVIDLYQDNPASPYWVEALSLTAHNLSVSQWRSLLLSAGWTQVGDRQVPLPGQIKPDAFTPSPYFPNYDIYRSYCDAGSLLLTAQKLAPPSE